jgi:DNA-binding NarL/FixJ family response regulator
MIAPIQRSKHSPPRWHRAFLAMLPAIVRCLRVAFRALQDEAREEAIQEALANTCIAYARLVQRGAADRAFPTVLARFAAAQVREGRRVGSRRNVRDVLSPYAQRKKQFFVERLDRFDTEEGQWLEAVVEDPHTPVFDQVWFRIDFPAWLDRLTPRHRRIAQTLALGHSTGEVARQFGISAGRVSQLRRELYESWCDFHGE